MLCFGLGEIYQTFHAADLSFFEPVKEALTSRKAEVVEMYQPMTDLMRRCQDAITECMEAMLVELKRDHSLVCRMLGLS